MLQPSPPSQQSPSLPPPESSSPADCLACRITGTATCIGVATYVLYERSQLTFDPAASTSRNALRNFKWHRGLLGVMGAGFIGLGVFRATM
ncbi:uncharacterized protein EV422DRAFT_64851 [Fimicolochytrium jonesii]|uniref:uncharacterized protein n=1 Tax=Fimicolochytrium jonesii TaxID=1396493 RepID=UPI0022FECF60|nr:uncharacterized protein EV422DRAFT_64851 [Fimicolochytrium jonesii]KAI8820822.1 hypothetical protein EV422DRAFT_64851 [Fimicolochytrium jonesii]